MHVATLDVAIRASEIDILHSAHIVAFEVRIGERVESVGIDDYNLAWLDIAHKFGTYYVESASLGTNDITAIETTNRQWSQAIFVASAIEAFVAEDEERKGSLNHIERIDDIVDTMFCVVVFLDQVGEQFAVGC